MRAKLYLGLLLVLASAGCVRSSDRVVPEPERITLRDALVSTVGAINAAYEEARKPGNQVIGYYPCTVTAVFNISASGVTDNKIGGGLTAGLPKGISISSNVSTDNSLTGVRGNQVTVVFASSLCAPGQAAETARIPPPPLEKLAPPKRCQAGNPLHPVGSYLRRRWFSDRHMSIRTLDKCPRPTGEHPDHPVSVSGPRSDLFTNPPCC